jgi:membrane fusion protein (multidrug efflux system)
VRAPFTGSVVRLICEVGEWIPQGGEVVELVDLETVLVQVDVPESAIGNIKVGLPVQVYFDALKERLEGRVRHIIAQADPAARTFPVEVEFANADHRLLAGMFGRATIPLGQSEPQVCVPKDAVVDRQGQAYVVAVMETPQGVMGMPMPVTLGGSLDRWVAITSGNIGPGMDIAVRGNEIIVVPMSVMVMPAEQLTGLPSTTQPAQSQAHMAPGAPEGQDGPEKEPA